MSLLGSRARKPGASPARWKCLCNRTDSLQRRERAVSADFVVKVGEEIAGALLRMPVRPVVAARSSWSDGLTPWYQRPLHNFNATSRSRNTCGDSGRRSCCQPCKAAQILCDSC